jgi:antitoxin component YwqK of YwqJK toxin-antitoxin module
MRNGTAALLSGAVVLTAMVLSWQAGCQPQGNQLGSPGIPQLAAGTATSAAVAPKALRLAGEVTWGNTTRKFEIVFDGCCSCSREWCGPRWDGVVGITLPYWSGTCSPSGGVRGYGNHRDSTAWPRRLWPATGLAGTSEKELTFRRGQIEEVFSDLHRHGPVNIPHRILISESVSGIEKGAERLGPHWFVVGDPKIYTVEEVEFLYTDQTDSIMALRKRYFGDVRDKSYNFPNGAKGAEHIYNGEVPVLDMEWYREGGIKQVVAHDENGIPTSRVEWHPNGQKKMVTTWAGRTMGWTEWSADGVKASEGSDDGQTQWMISYYLNGQKHEVLHKRYDDYLDTKLNGVYQRWDENGLVLDDGTFRNGRPWTGTFSNRLYLPPAPGYVNARSWKDGKPVDVATTQPRN